MNTEKQSKVLTGNTMIKIRPESATNETSTMECNNQIDRQVMQELIVLPGSIYVTNLVQKILSESATIRRTARKCHNQKNIKKVQQSKAFPERVTIKRSVIECHNHGYCHSGGATIKST